MDLFVTLEDAATRRRSDVRVDAGAGATVADLSTAVESLTASLMGATGPVEPDGSVIRLEDRRRSPGGATTAPAAAVLAHGNGLWFGGRRLAPDEPLTDVGVVDGCVLGVGGPAGTTPQEPVGVVELRVVGGPGAGVVHRLGPGEYSLGSAAPATLVVDDPLMDDVAFELTVSTDGDVRVDDESDTWPAGDQRTVADTVLLLAAPDRPDASLERDDDGGLAYNRPPRLMPARPDVKLARPTQPTEPDKPPFPWIMVMAPLALSLGMFFTIGGGSNPSFLLFGLMSPVMAVANVVSSRRAGRKRHKGKSKDYVAALEEFEATLATAITDEEVARRVASPDPAEVLLTAVGPRRRLWERRDDDADALSMRVGLADLPATLSVAEESVAVGTVPVVLPLMALGVAGIAGPRALRAPLARWLVGQAAVLHSPQELSIVVLTAGRRAADSEPEWGWSRWLPHLKPRSGEPCVALIGTDLETSARRIGELTTLVERRVAAAAKTRGRTLAMTPVLVVLDGARELRRLPGMPTVLDDGPAVGVVAIALDDDERTLPEECRAVVTADPGDPARIRVRVTGAPSVDDVLADGVSIEWAERVGRALAPVRDVSRDEESAGLPQSVRLLDMLGMDVPTPSDIQRQWVGNGRSTTSLLGQAVEGPYAVDMRTDGPHALIAGTTGAGKSELLQTMIGSLAVANRPDEMNFVLVDYKGGAAFKDCAKLPHTVGLVTDLDAHLTARALDSLSAELKRREEQLAHVEAKDIEDYLDAMRTGDEPMPRLMIVIDEFASLKAELPEFVKGLVGIAQRGRSLGVHLVLATQRPAGVVSADIKANTNLRIALRVTDETDSSDVIDAPDAARIARSTPGRAYVRTGHSSLTAFQSARVGGRAPSAADTRSLKVHPVPWHAISTPAPTGTSETVADDETDLARLVVAITQAAASSNIEPGPSPWLPALPDVLTLDTVPEVRSSSTRPGAVSAIAYGLMDLPALQQRAPLVLDVEQGGNLAFIGTQRTGRSTALRTIAAQIASTVSARDLHLYALDFGNNALLPLSALPHCGAVVPRDQPERADRLISLLAREVTRRQVLLAAAGVADIAEQRATAAPDDRLPYLVLMLDRWEGFTAAFEDVDMGRLIQSTTRLLAEGGAVGLRGVVTGDRSLLSGRTSTVLDHRVVLRLADRQEYGFAGINARELPEHLPPGRGFTPETMTEVQIAVLDEDTDGSAQVRVLQERAHNASERDAAVPPSLRPARVDLLPVSITVHHAMALTAERLGKTCALVGVGGDTLSPRWLDVARDGPGLLVAGPMRSGRSTALMTMTRSLLDQGWNAIIVTPRRSPLRTFSLLPGVVEILDGDASGQAFTDAVAKAMRPLVVVIDDLELMPLDGPLPDVLIKHLGSIRDTGEAVIAAGTTSDVVAGYRGLPKEIRRTRSGILLTPQSYTDGETFGLRLPRSTGGPAPEGRGLLVVGGLHEPVQVAIT